MTVRAMLVALLVRLATQGAEMVQARRQQNPAGAQRRGEGGA